MSTPYSSIGPSSVARTHSGGLQPLTTPASGSHTLFWHRHTEKEKNKPLFFFFFKRTENLVRFSKNFLPNACFYFFPQRLPKQIEERNERLKEEMLGKFASMTFSLDHNS